jgi:hypothetical protein
VPIKLKCPNAGCGKQLTVRDDLAGKIARCPACRQAMKIPTPRPQAAPQAKPRRTPSPAAANDEPGMLPIDEPAREPVEEPPPPPTRRPPTVVTYQATPPAPAYDDAGYEEVDDPLQHERDPYEPTGADDYDVIDESEEEYEPVRRPSETRRYRDEYDEPEDDDAPRRRRRGRRFRRPRRKSSLDTSDVVGMAVGIALLVFLGLTTLMPWVYASASVGNFNMSTSMGGDMSILSSWEGKLILGGSLGAGVLVGLALALSFSVPPPADEILVDAGNSVAGGWGTLVAIWMIGFPWKMFHISFAIKSRIREFQNQAKALNRGMANNPALNQKIDFSFYPHVGMWLCFLVALGVVGLFCYQVANRQQTVWLAVAQAVGLLGGLMLLIFNVKPWEALPGIL